MSPLRVAAAVTDHDRADADGGSDIDGDTDADADTDDAPGTEANDDDSQGAPSPDGVRRNTPGRGVTPAARRIEPAAPESFGLTQAWWGGGKGKTTAALGMGFRAAGHGYRVHLLQFMKGGADSVEDVRGEYNAIAAMPGFSYETTGNYGWHGFLDGSDEDEHGARARAAVARTEELLAAAADADLTAPLDPAGDPEDGVHMLLLDEVLYAADTDLIDESDVLGLLDAKPDGLELVLTGSHTAPEYLYDEADLVTEVRKVKHPFDEGTRARKGTEY